MIGVINLQGFKRTESTGSSTIRVGESHLPPCAVSKIPIPNPNFFFKFDLSRNYLNGSIPSSWGSMQLTNISLLGNRLTGPITKEIGNISTLVELVLEINQLNGTLPPELGNLTQISRLLFTSNNFTGPIPDSFAKLTTLTDFRIGDNHFTGSMPSYITNWTNLQKLVIQASGLQGPIPDGISSLTAITDLRISDINGSAAAFPPLSNLDNLKTLILRSCNINGTLPEYLGRITSLKNLSNFFLVLIFTILVQGSQFQQIKWRDSKQLFWPIRCGLHVLDREPAEWNCAKLDAKKWRDLSYNNFTVGNSGRVDCQQQGVGLASCFGSYTCPKTFYYMRINCGGEEVNVDRKTTYEADTNSGGAATFFQNTASNWAFSNTGNFMDDDRSTDYYIATNTSTLLMDNSELYMNARISPISLTYYGYCLKNGNYTVKLHFAEIIFTSGSNYSSLGRRIFNVYIQGEQVLKDFNIENEAGGAGKAIIKNFTSIPVSSNTLEIRFYWAGKGTTAIPDRGVYGPLISAISVDPEFSVPVENGNSMSAGAIVGIVVAVVSVIALVLCLLWWKGCLGRKNTMEEDLRGLDLQTGSFTLRQIKAATNNFDAANKIGEGGFGSVYQGILSDGTIIAVKQLSSKSKQGNREFVNEIGMISALQHPHLVKLYGCCIESNQLLLVYEYMENNSLARALFGPEEYQIKLDWPTRHKICMGIARGLAYLHEESRLKIVHRDIKATNVLLDKNLNPKISDFGLAKLDEEDNTHISTRIAGTFGYMAPEYAMRGYLTDKADVYSFGIVALEIVSGRSNTTYRQKDDFYLLDWALLLKENGSLLDLVDPRMGSDYNKEEVLVMINVALLCTNVSPAVRPSMSSVVSMLEGKTIVKGVASNSNVSKDEMMLKATEKQRNYIQEEHTRESQGRNLSLDGPWTASSTSANDLYPVNLDSDYLSGRS
ncbi:Serine-threonine/tyrosine-protein kinase, catalytic domain [Dillenia turbinata]|uniref:non-specific serine/threonine protein kinase n=1 Tax=Dillenia turbinata TaxID=194707 RepID=A0AAN8WIB3_9MAGN